jgi:hypothetical protein
MPISPWIEAKVERAAEHATVVGDGIAVWIASDPVEFVGEENEARTELRMVARFKDPVPTLRWAVEVGELVHSLRSALDNLAWDLALIRTRKPPRSTAFPILWVPKTRSGHRPGRSSPWLDGREGAGRVGYVRTVLPHRGVARVAEPSGSVQRRRDPRAAQTTRGPPASSPTAALRGARSGAARRAEPCSGSEALAGVLRHARHVGALASSPRRRALDVCTPASGTAPRRPRAARAGLAPRGREPDLGLSAHPRRTRRSRRSARAFDDLVDPQTGRN